MQTTMTLDACARCGQPIAPGEPAMQTASVDIIGGRAVSTPVKSYHLRGRCYDDAFVPPTSDGEGVGSETAGDLRPRQAGLHLEPLQALREVVRENVGP